MSKSLKIMISFIVVMSLCFSIAFANASTYQIDSKQIDTQYVKGQYPVVSVDNILVKSRINKQINKIIDEYECKVQKDNTHGYPETGMVSYEIKANNSKVLSMIINCSTMNEKAAHPNTYTFGLTFDQEGNLVQLSQVINETSVQGHSKDYSVDHLNKMIKAQMGDKLYPFFTDVKEFPKEFYLDDNLDLHVLFQRYDIAPYAVGLVDIILP